MTPNEFPHDLRSATVSRPFPTIPNHLDNPFFSLETVWAAKTPIKTPQTEIAPLLPPCIALPISLDHPHKPSQSLKNIV